MLHLFLRNSTLAYAINNFSIKFSYFSIFLRPKPLCTWINDQSSSINYVYTVLRDFQNAFADCYLIFYLCRFINGVIKRIKKVNQVFSRTSSFQNIFSNTISKILLLFYLINSRLNLVILSAAGIRAKHARAYLRTSNSCVDVNP